MTVELNWPPDVVGRIVEDARQSGLSLDDYVLQTVLGNKLHDSRPHTDEDAARQSREEAGRMIRELSKGNSLGPDLTVRDLIEEGRRY